MRGMKQLALAALAASTAMSQNRIYGFDAIRRYLQKQPRRYRTTGSIAKGNRWTGQPHEHKQEIARRRRQQKRLSVR